MVPLSLVTGGAARFSTVDPLRYPHSRSFDYTLLGVRTDDPCHLETDMGADIEIKGVRSILQLFPLTKNTPTPLISGNAVKE
jgi:hypothetical protein